MFGCSTPVRSTPPSHATAGTPAWIAAPWHIAGPVRRLGCRPGRLWRRPGWLRRGPGRLRRGPRWLWRGPRWLRRGPGWLRRGSRWLRRGSGWWWRRGPGWWRRAMHRRSGRGAEGAVHPKDRRARPRDAIGILPAANHVPCDAVADIQQSKRRGHAGQQGPAVVPHRGIRRLPFPPAGTVVDGNLDAVLSQSLRQVPGLGLGQPPGHGDRRAVRDQQRVIVGIAADARKQRRRGVAVAGAQGNEHHHVSGLQGSHPRAAVRAEIDARTQPRATVRTEHSFHPSQVGPTGRSVAQRLKLQFEQHRIERGHVVVAGGDAVLHGNVRPAPVAQSVARLRH